MADNVLFSLTNPRGVIVLASLCVLLHVIGSYQVYTVPVYDMNEQLLLKRSIKVHFVGRLFHRTTYVCFTTLIAVILPFFGDLLGFIGALATGPATFLFPPLIWIVLMRPRFLSGHWLASYFCVLYGTVVTVLGSIGGLRSIINLASGYTFFQ